MRTRRSISSGVVAVALGVTAALLPPVATASHTTGTLCTGYKPCQSEGRSSAGYAKHNDRMYWQMYSGHNCTNYVAYRMVRKGMSNKRPWSGYGNAMHWGHYLKGRTDRTPRVGAVAWWKANTARSGSSGHVAYVEKVLSRSRIVVSQDSWGGDFSWATVTKTTGWPTGFIHLKDTPLRNLARPSVSGTARVGKSLSATRGRWNPRPAVRYRWTVGGKQVSGDKPTLRLSRHMIGKRVQVQTVATRLGYPRTVVASRPTRVVAPGRFGLDRSPDLSGRAQVKGRLSVTTGSWSPRPSRIGLQWYAGGKPVPGADSRSLRLRPGMAGERVSVAVTAKRRGYTTRTTTVGTKHGIRPARLRLSGPPTLGGKARSGKTLRVRLRDTKPQAQRAVQWLRDGEPVRGAQGRRYRLGRDDLGHRISARVTYRKKGYYTHRSSTGRTGPIKTRPRVRTSVDRTRRAVVLRVTARAGGRGLRTKVIVKRRGDVLAATRLRGGQGVLRIRGLPQGRSRIKVILKATSRSEGYEQMRGVRR